MKNHVPATQHIIVIFLWLVIFFSPLLAVNDDHDMGRVMRVWSHLTGVFVLFSLNHILLMPQLFFKGREKQYLFITSALIILLGVVYLIYAPIYMKECEGINPSKPIFLPAINGMLVAVLMIGFDLGLNISMRWLDSQRQQSELEKENSEVKLALLHKQITPHFFMNMLNNIHSLVDIDAERAQRAIIQLSKLMSYQLYETNSARVSLSNEIEFIENYVNLMRLRYPNRVNIEFRVGEGVEGVLVPPLIFLNFIENAFKHGVSYREESFIHINISKTQGFVLLDLSNSNHAKNNDEQRVGGIGVDNNRKRLDLIFGSKYKLDIDNNKDIYHVKLSIPT